MIKNPVSEGIGHMRKQLEILEWDGSKILPSAIMAVVICLVIALFVIVWLYGLFAVMEALIRELMGSTRSELKDKSFVQKTPYVVAMGIYSIFWAPFALLCLPMVIIGLIGEFFTQA